MDVNKSLKIARYVFGGGFVVHSLLLFTMLLVSRELKVEGWLTLYLAGCLVMAVGLYLNLKAKGLKPFKGKRFYATVLVLTIPLFGPLAAIGIMFGTPDSTAPTHKWRIVLFSPSMIVFYCCIAFGIIAYPQIYSFRAYGGMAAFKAAQRHFAMAGESGRNEDFRKEIDEAAHAIVTARRSALTDANTGWYVRYTLSSRIVKESELAELEAAIGAAKASGPGDIK